MIAMKRHEFIKLFSLAIVLVQIPSLALAAEDHVDRVVEEILANVRKLKDADPEAVPMAFWDFDGTIIKGDVSEGLIEDGQERYKGLVEQAILAGWSPFYKGEEGWRRYRDSDYPRLNALGRWISWPFNAQIFAGAKLDDFDRFCKARYADTYRKWFFVSSVAILRRLEEAGVENHIVSASPEIFVANAAEFLGLERTRMNAIRVSIDGGHVTTCIEYPVPYGEGKVDLVRRVVRARPHAVAIAGFGNSYSTDGAFLRYIVCQRALPGGACGFALMINGSNPQPCFEGLFTCVKQDAVDAP